MKKSKKQKYTFTYFLRKLRSKPATKWITGGLDGTKRGQHCALGFCKEGAERSALIDLFQNELGLWVAGVNDGDQSAIDIAPWLKGIPSPKARILKGFELIRQKRKATKVA